MKRALYVKQKGIGMKVFLGIVLAVIFVGLFNLGIETFYNSPDYDDYCNTNYPCPEGMYCTMDNTAGMTCEQDYSCCQELYNEATGSYQNNIFYIFVVAGLILAIAGLFIVSLPFQILGVAGGSFLIIEGILRNLQNKTLGFIAGVLVFIILCFFVWRKFRK